MIVVLISLSRSPPISRCLHFCPTSVVVLLSSLYQSSQQGSNTRIICLNSEETHRHKDTPNHTVHHQLKLRIARVPRANRFQVKWSDLRAITLLGPSPHNCPISQLSSLVYVVTPCGRVFLCAAAFQYWVRRQSRLLRTAYHFAPNNPSSVIGTRDKRQPATTI